jgi:outer membrane protein
MRLFLLLIASLFSNFLQAETLLELYKQAEAQNPQLRMANTTRLLVLEKQPQARASLLPQVTVSATADESSRAKDWLSGNKVENTNVGYNLSLSYSLYHRDREIALEQADSQVKAAEAVYESARQTLMEQAATGYFAVLAGSDNLKWARGAKDAFQRQLDQAKQRFNVGLIAITDVQEAQAAFDLAVADEIKAQNDLDNAKEALREVTGTYHEALASLNEEAPLLGPDPPQIDAWTNMALQQNPQLLAARYEVETARQDIDKQRAAHLPTVDVVGRHSYSDTLRGQENPGNMATSNSIGVQLNYVLYEGGAVNSRIREAQGRYTQALDKVALLRNTVQHQTHGAFLNLLSNISRIKALKQALVSTKTALEAVKTGFEVGTRTTVDVVNVERDLLKAQGAYSTSRYDYVLATIRLKQAVGNLTVEDLIALNDWLTSLKIELEMAPPMAKQSEVSQREGSSNKLKEKSAPPTEEEKEVSRPSKKKEPSTAKRPAKRHSR